MIVDLIDDFIAEYRATAGGSEKVDTGEADEMIDAIAKTVAELTSRQDGVIRQQLIEQLIREIMNLTPSFVEKTRQAQLGLMRGTSGRKD
jgi:hypothetical protein